MLEQLPVLNCYGRNQHDAIIAATNYPSRELTSKTPLHNINKHVK
jgi:hypothetical protein